MSKGSVIENEQAFRHLFNEYKNRVYGYILAITNSHHASEEITQELFIKLWTSRSLLAQVENIDSYIFVMARHFAISYLRKHLAEEAKMKQIHERLQSYAAAPDESIIEQEYLLLLQKAIDALSPMRKQVYLLSRSHEMNLDKIAEHLNLSRNTVKNHLVEALKQIREQLGAHGIGMLLLFTLLNELNK